MTTTGGNEAGGKRKAFAFFSTGSRLHLTILALVGIWIILYPLIGDPQEEGKIRGDSIQYFSYLQSVFEDGDLQFRDDYEELYPAGRLPEKEFLYLPTGYAANYFAPGAPICWAPFYLAGKAYVGLTGAPDRTAELNILIAATRLGGRFFTAVTLFLIFLILRRFFDPNYSLLGTLAVFFCTAFYVYGLHNTLLSHNIAAFSVALFILLVLRSGPQRNLRQWIIVGAAAGFVALCRWQNVVIVVWLAVEQLPLLITDIKARSGVWKRIGRAALSALVFFAVFSPQLILWWIIFGPFKTPLSYHINAVYWDRPEIINVLFSARHGLLSWHPIVYFGLIGLVMMLRRERVTAIATLLSFAILLYLNSVTGDWWAGDSFGMRRFVSFSAVFALGIGAFALALKRWFGRWPQIAPAGLVLLFAWWNLASLGLYQSGGISHDRPPTFGTMVSRQVQTEIHKFGYPFTWPGSWIHAWMIGGGSPDEADWIFSTYLFYRQNNLGGRIKAEYPSYRDGFSRVRGGSEPFRLLGDGQGTLYISRFALWQKFYSMIIDGTLRDEALEPDETALIEVRLNGRRLGIYAGAGRIMRRWEPIQILRTFWRRGLNRIDLALFVGDKGRLNQYLSEDGFHPEGDATIRPNRGDYSLKITEVRFFRGKSTSKMIRRLYREGPQS